ncbi:MAG: plastocyanin/azurin family copper-binding protein [Herbaspirillum sp.]
MITRRTCLKTSALIGAGLAFPELAYSASKQRIVEIQMWGSQDGSKVGFDPIGVWIEPGQTVRWVLNSSVHTTTAYHPKNGNHSLRIPEAAVPWDSGYLINPKDHFDVTLTTEGVYDYFCIPHEMAGMVGRIIVGHATGPGAQPFDYFKHDPKAAKWLAVPAAAAKAFPSVADILHKKIVRNPGVS